MSLAVATNDTEVRAAAPTNSGIRARLLRRPLAVVCLAYLALLAGVAVIAPIVLPGVATQNAGNLFAVAQGPSLHHLLGTDTLGRDVFERLLVGTRVTLVGVAEALITALAIAVPVGLYAGYHGGWTDRGVNWLTDLGFSIPGLVIVFVVLSVFPGSMLAGMVTVGVLSAPWLIRIIRSATLSVRQEDYIYAAQVSGLSTNYILFRHILPRISGVIFVQASLLAAGALGAQAGLAFLGLIVPNPAPSWGGMVDDGSNVLLVHPWLVWPPGIAIGLTMLALCFLGDILRDTSTEAWSGSTSLHSSRPAVSTSASAATAPVSGALLSVSGLTVSFNDGRTPVIEDVTFSVSKGEAVGIVGESGSGKSITTKAIIGLLPAGGRVDDGAIFFDGRDLLALSESSLEGIRGHQIGFVTQEPMNSLDPAFRVGSQVSEAVRRHLRLSRQGARERALDLLASVHLPDPKAVALKYPHELSGGMLQRVAIARALAGEPKLLIADEPTSALDASIRTEILDLLDELRKRRDMAILLVTHDWGVVAGLCDRVQVMYAGQLVEEGDALAVFDGPLHPYTEALLRSDPRGVSGDEWLQAIPGAIAGPDNWPAGCHFAPRCSYASDACRAAPVALVEAAPARETRCIHYDQVRA